MTHNYIYIPEIFLDLYMLNAQYAGEDDNLELKEAVKNKIIYLVNKMACQFIEIKEDFQNGKMYPFQYDSYLKGYKAILDFHKTGLECYRHPQFENVRQEITTRNI